MPRAVFLPQTDENDFTTGDTSLTAALRVARHASTSISRARQGRLAFVSPGTAPGRQHPQAGHAVSRAGRGRLTRTLTRTRGTCGVTADVFAPGGAETAITLPLTDQQYEHIQSQIPVVRAAPPERIAAAERFLFSDLAAHVSHRSCCGAGRREAVDGTSAATRWRPLSMTGAVRAAWPYAMCVPPSTTRVVPVT
ncbi:SDR family oxidoreductase [Streptomyces sp. TLI_146]|uniref:SDR family oxidoreductase n=1 Tax=Streptomyces sp. TLI_146 TaxID=1938858 RepID=UPI000C713A1F